MANVRWFTQFYPEIEYLFDYLPGTKVPRSFKVDLYKYSGELIFHINNKLDSKKIAYKKSDILTEVVKFINRKIQPKKTSFSIYS